MGVLLVISFVIVWLAFASPFWQEESAEEDGASDDVFGLEVLSGAVDQVLP